jgi:hypothetical protein
MLSGLQLRVQTHAEETAMPDHVHDFDFLIGKWHVRHRRLKERLADCHDWLEFDGATQFWLTMDGRGNIDDNYVGLPGAPYRAVTIRSYDPTIETWAIWWLDARSPHTIEAPVFGNFKDGVGTFQGDDIFDGKPIKVRFIWSHITANSARWEQAFSPDGGEIWEVNWRMDFARDQ